MSGSRRLRELTDGERWWLWRRRRAWSQGEACRHLRVSRNFYQHVEGGEYRLRMNSAQFVEPRASELFVIARRRAKLSVGAVAEALGVSRPTIYDWEASCDSRLEKFWRKKKFTLA